MKSAAKSADNREGAYIFRERLAEHCDDIVTLSVR